MARGSSSMSSLLRRVLRRSVRRGTRKAVRQATRGSGAARGNTGSRGSGSVGTRAPEHAARGLADRASSPVPALDYAPQADGDPDPGEVCWAWVPFEEDVAQGKDRPVLVLAIEDANVGGTDGSGHVAVAFMLTSRDRGQGVHTDEHGSTWVDIGTGPWDDQGRPSEVRVDRLLRLPLGSVRREGARLDRERYDHVVRHAARVHGW